MSTLDLETLHIAGTLSSQYFVPPAQCIDNAAIKVRSAGTPIDAAKVDHQHREVYANGVGKSTTVSVSETAVVHVAKANGTLKRFSAGAVTPATGNSTVTVDLKKNGITVLTAVISLSVAQTARQVVSATVLTTAYLAGDVFEVTTVTTVGTGTLPAGLFAYADFYESAE